MEKSKNWNKFFLFNHLMILRFKYFLFMEKIRQEPSTIKKLQTFLCLKYILFFLSLPFREMTHFCRYLFFNTINKPTLGFLLVFFFVFSYFLYIFFFWLMIDFECLVLYFNVFIIMTKYFFDSLSFLGSFWPGWFFILHKD